jgi:hypothetical protein
MKSLRMQQLEELNQDGFVPRVPDGVALIEDSSASLSTPHLLTNGPIDHSLPLPSTSPPSATTPRLFNPILCYICRKPYTELHFFYHQLCPDCAVFNFSKREEKADMRGMICLVTGARTKIGYRTALKLLRCGAFVIATTRFPADASTRYAQEKDSEDWLHLLQVCCCSFSFTVLIAHACLSGADIWAGFP